MTVTKTAKSRNVKPRSGQVGARSDPAGSAGLKAAVCVLLVVLSLTAYWQVFGFGFVDFDDSEYVRDNPHVNAGLTADSISWSLSAIYKGTWQPAVWMSYMVDREISARALHSSVADPRVCHVTNIVIHVFNGLLVFFLLSLMTGSLWRSAFVSFLFAVHPLHVETVAWIADRKGLLSTLFGLLAMLAYVSYVRRPSIWRYALVALAFGLSLMAKPMLASLPLVLLLLDYWPLERGNLRWRLAWEKMPLAAMSAASFVVTFIAQRAGSAMPDFGDFSLPYRIANAAISYSMYVLKMFWPVDLAAFYPPFGARLPVWGAIVSGVALAATTALAIRAARKAPYLAVGWLFYIVTLLPAIGIVQVGWHAMADRFTYVPLIGLFIVIAWGVPDLLGRYQSVSRLLAVPAVLVVAALAVCTWIQVGFWRDPYSLFDHAVRATTNNCLAYEARAAALVRRGSTDQAIDDYNKAIEIEPSYAEAYGGLGTVLVETGRVEEGVGHLQTALRLGNDGKAVHYELAFGYYKLNKFDLAGEQCEEALVLDPQYAMAHNLLGGILAQQGKLDEAISHWKSVVELDPSYADAHENLAMAYMHKKDYKAAWDEIHLFKSEGGQANPKLVSDLARHMPDPSP